MCLAVTFFFLKNKNKNINCFLQICMALNLFLHTADLMPGLYTETNACGEPLLQSMNAYNEHIGEYIQMLAREEALSPIPLPDSKLFKNQVSCTKARMRACVRACAGPAQSRASLFTPPGLVPSQPRSSQRDQTSDTQMCARALCSNNGLLSTQRAWVSLSSLATYISHHYGRLSGPNGTTSILQINYWPYFSNTLTGAPGGTLGIPLHPAFPPPKQESFCLQ